MRRIRKTFAVNRFVCLIPLILAVLVWGIVAYLHIMNEHAQATGVIVKIENSDSTTVMDHPQFVKEPYEPIVLDGTNIAPDAKADASSFQETYVPRKVIDGKTKGDSYWEGAADTYPNKLILTWKEMHQCHAIKVCLCPNTAWSERIQSFSVEISRDGESFEELLPEKDYIFTPDTGNEVVLECPEEQIMGIQLVFTENTGASGAQVAEFEVYEK